MALVPPTVVTVTLTVPVPDGLVAVMDDGESATTVAALDPNMTALAPVSSVPVIVTEVPPPVGPLEGLTEVTVGTATYVKSSAGLAKLVPPAVVTVTSTLPAAPPGLVTMIDV